MGGFVDNAHAILAPAPAAAHLPVEGERGFRGRACILPLSANEGHACNRFTPHVGLDTSRWRRDT
jgi:hypothetical protein